MQVGHLCCEILCHLSDRELAEDYDLNRRGRAVPRVGRNWFAKAREFGEEKWLVDHAIPTAKKIHDSVGIRPSGHILRILGAKYPKHLVEVYRSILKKQPSVESVSAVEAILASQLTREQKATLLAGGVTHKNLFHRVNALGGLARVEKARFKKHLLTILQRREVPPLEYLSPQGLLSFVEEAHDPACWDAFTNLTREAAYGDRMEVVRDLGLLEPPDKVDPIRRERIRFLVRFLDDRTSEDPEAVRSDWDTYPVRDYAADQLAGLLRFPVDRRFDYWIKPGYHRGSITRLIRREAVRILAERELAKPENHP